MLLLRRGPNSWFTRHLWGHCAIVLFGSPTCWICMEIYGLMECFRWVLWITLEMILCRNHKGFFFVSFGKGYIKCWILGKFSFVIIRRIIDQFSPAIGISQLNFLWRFPRHQITHPSSLNVNARTKYSFLEDKLKLVGQVKVVRVVAGWESEHIEFWDCKKTKYLKTINFGGDPVN